MENEEDKPPTHIITDWNYFLKHLDNKEIQVESYFDKENFKTNCTLYRGRVTHIFDPSHFWIVFKECEVDALHKYLHSFYSKYKDHYKIPQKYFKANMYCVTYTEGAFYRSIFVNLPLAINNEFWAFVFLIDFGYMAKVSLNEIYFMTCKLYTIPRLAVRAALSGVGPVESSTWTSDVATKFSTLVLNKTLFCQVTQLDTAEKVVYLRLGDYNCDTQSLDSIIELLISEGLATQLSLLDVRDMKHTEKRKIKKSNIKHFSFLFPTFDEIEDGTFPDTLLGNIMLKNYC